MSACLTPLLSPAMVGTDRMATPLPSWPGEVGQLIAQLGLESSTSALAVLRAAAVLAACELAGAQGEPGPAAIPAAAPPDRLPVLSDGPVRSAVAWAMDAGPARLQHEVCTALIRAGCRLPPALLPSALALGRRTPALRPVLLPVLGQRGLWLAAQQEDWHYALALTADGSNSNSEAVWHEGSTAQRQQLLQRERATDPAAARQRLIDTMADLPARERAELVGVLAVALSGDDEALLDSLRADRSREVRQAACALLLRLPQAAHPARAMARLDPLLTQERVLLRKRWRIDAPAVAAADWKADNIDVDRPKNESLGERAWWLYQLTRQVPLGWWTQHLGLSPAELLRWAGEGDWAEALVRGWRDVLLITPNAAWCEALLAHGPVKGLRDDPATWLALLPLVARERHWQRQLGDGSVALNALVMQMTAACGLGETLSRPVSIALVASLCERAQGYVFSNDYAVRPALPDLCAVLHLDALPGLAKLPRHDDDTASFTLALDAMTQVAAVRLALHTPLNTTPP